MIDIFNFHFVCQWFLEEYFQLDVGPRPSYGYLKENGAHEMSLVIAYCRAGFERDCAMELSPQLPTDSATGHSPLPGGGAVALSLSPSARPHEVARNLSFAELVFARQVLVSPGRLGPLPAGDRIPPILESLGGIDGWLGKRVRYGEVFLEVGDTPESKELLGFCRKFTPPLMRALEGEGRLCPASQRSPWRLHLFLLSSTELYPGIALTSNSSPWLMGIPRLKFPAGAPSRSTLKLEEAFLHFLDEKATARTLKPGMHAVDLGAAPGGWTYQLVHRQMLVTAVDNGPMDRTLLETGQVEHRREDGFRFRPRKPVDWMVCDMIEHPERIARLVGQWIGRGLCRQSIFNLKIPMKKRYEVVQRCAELLRAEVHKNATKNRSTKITLAFKQLYHDRDEVTGYVTRPP